MAQDPTQDQDPQREWLSVNEVAAELGMHPATVRKWAQNGTLPATRVGQRHWRFRRTALDQMLQSGAVPGRDDPSGPPEAQAPLPDRQELALTSEDDLIDHDPDTTVSASRGRHTSKSGASSR